MAPSLKRKRPNVSYREPSTSDGSAGEETGESRETNSHRQRRSTRTATRLSDQGSNHKVSYKESSSDDSSDQEVDPEPAHEIRPRRSAPIKSAVQTRSRSKRKSTSASKRSSQRPSGRSRLFHTKKSHSSKRASRDAQNSQQAEPIPSDGVKPDWSTLPYQVLLQIFVYASHPVQATSALWLLRICQMCRSFTEPALTALYRSPPLMSLDKVHLNKFVDSLLDSPPSRTYNYNNKIRSLELDVTRMPSFTPSNHSLLDLGGLVQNMPQLVDIDLYDPADIPPYRRNTLSVRWHYPDGLFAALETANIRLRSWRWNYLLFLKHQSIPWMKQIHESTPFKGLSNLILNNFEQVNKCKEDIVEPSLGESLAAALSVLSNLRELTFESCPDVTGDFLALLPANLQSLHVINCNDLDSNALQAFIITHGNFMKEMVLNHNQSLDLSFLPTLKAACPHLELFHMDLNYYNTFATHHDSDPKYEDLLSPQEVPSWPLKLQSLKLVYLRKWTSEAAETLFQSLIDSANDLPYLRELVLKAILDISWRDRAQFRDKWIGRLRKTFLKERPRTPPHLVSLRAFREWKQKTSTPRLYDIPPTNPDVPSDACGETRTAQRSTEEETDATAPEEDSSWRGRKLRPRNSNGLGANTEEKTSGDESSDALNQDFEDLKFVQGRCHIVDVSIDNLRPREELFDERDFLDEEASGDEDWNEDVDDIEMGESRYAW